MNVRMADGTARCDKHIDGQPQGDTNDSCIYCPEERVQEEAPQAFQLPILTPKHDGIGWCLMDGDGAIRGVADTYMGIKALRFRILRRLSNKHSRSAHN